MHIGIIRDAFTPGNVIYSGYWRTCDKVIYFQESGSAWQVHVIACDDDGNELPGAQSRWHCTPPDLLRDKIIQRAVLGADVPERIWKEFSL